MLNIFQYLEKTKGKQIPLEYKILNGLPLTGEAHIKHSLNLYEYKLTYLPDNMSIDGYLDIRYSNIKKIPNNLFVRSELDMSYSKISELPDNLYVGGSLYCYGTPLAERIKNDTSLLEKYSKLIKGKIFF